MYKLGPHVTSNNGINQDGYGRDVLICYGILPLWDMNRKTGATAIVPGSHKCVAEIERRRREFDREVFKDSPGHHERARLMSEYQRLDEEERNERGPQLIAKFRALIEKYPEMKTLEQAARRSRQRFFDPFTENGLTPAIINAKAGDLIIFVSGLQTSLCCAIKTCSCTHHISVPQRG